MLRIIRGRTLTLSAIASVIISAPAFALLDDVSDSEAELVEAGDEAGEEADETWELGTAGDLPYAFDEADGTLIVDISGALEEEAADEEVVEESGTDEDPAESTMCLPLPDGGADAAGAVAEPAEEEVPEGCLVVDVTGPNGQITHGSVVSNMVHAMKPFKHDMKEPFGHWVRGFAHSDMGKNGGDDLEATTEGTDETEAATDGTEEKVKGKKDKGGETGGGAPAHSNAGGNGKGKGKNK